MEYFCSLEGLQNIKTNTTVLYLQDSTGQKTASIGLLYKEKVLQLLWVCCQNSGLAATEDHTLAHQLVSSEIKMLNNHVMLAILVMFYFFFHLKDLP